MAATQANVVRYSPTSCPMVLPNWTPKGSMTGFSLSVKVGRICASGLPYVAILSYPWSGVLP
jgi:hypothetical protein